MSDAKRPLAKGRGSQINPPNRFGGPHHEIDFEHLEHDTDYLESLQKPATEYIPDRTKSIVAENDSPDVGFRYSINPYRGCSHGCSYCYARQTHEYLGFNAGLDFETKILVKEDAPELFREFLTRKNWVPEPIALSGVTDCYQPAERQFELTRRCLEVAAEFQQPMIIITKNALVLRDLDLLRDLASQNLVHVNLSVTTLDAELARSMEPRTSTPVSEAPGDEASRRCGYSGTGALGPDHPWAERKRDPNRSCRLKGSRGNGCRVCPPASSSDCRSRFLGVARTDASQPLPTSPQPNTTSSWRKVQ